MIVPIWVNGLVLWAKPYFGCMPFHTVSDDRAWYCPVKFGEEL